MKAPALAFLAAALSFGSPAVSLAASSDHPGESYDQEVGGTTSVRPHEQQAQLGSDRDHQRYCQDLQKRSQDLWHDAERSKDHGDFAHARDQLDQINDQLTRDCGK
jgi:hypothetical protein